MSDEQVGSAESSTREDLMSALFAQLVVQQTNLAMMLLGKVAHPETGQVHKDIDSARLFIDQLEMLELKTKGNLTREESGLLKQSLMNLRLAFVEAVDQPATASSEPARAGTDAPASQTATSPGTSPATPSSEEEEHRKKFSKKY
jgi:hypothetical protein